MIVEDEVRIGRRRIKDATQRDECRPHSIAWCWFAAIFGNFAVREFDQKLGRAELPERNWSSAATFFVVAHALGNVRLMTQRLAKSRLDGPYKQFIHTLLWII